MKLLAREINFGSQDVIEVYSDYLSVEDADKLGIYRAETCKDVMLI